MLVAAEEPVQALRGRTRRVLRYAFSAFNFRLTFSHMDGFGILNASDLRHVSLLAAAGHLAKSQIHFEEVKASSPSLGRVYRRRRLELARSALWIASDRVLLAVFKFLDDERPPPATS